MGYYGKGKEYKSFPNSIDGMKLYFGGGDSAPPDNTPMYTMMMQQNRQDNRLQRYQIDQDNKQVQQQHQWQLDAQAAMDQKAAADKANAIQAFQNDLASASAGARNYAGSKINQLGLQGGNDYGLQANFDALLANARSSVGSQTTGNAGDYVNGQTLFDQANNQTLAAQRNKLMQQYNQLYGNNYVDNQLDDTLLGGDESNLLTTQQTAAQQALERARARGQLNDQGYDYAVQQLGNQSAAARSKINNAGKGVLDVYRQKLTDALGGEKTALQNWNYGDQGDLSSFNGNVNSILNKAKTNASGDFLNAIGGQQFFDPTTLISGAGTYQGTLGGSGAGTGTGTGTGTNASDQNGTPLATKPVTGSTLQNQGIV